jgi:hypothetical protein
MTQDEKNNEDVDEKPIPATCVECGALIPESSDRCVVCGWSWKMPGETENFDGEEIPAVCAKCGSKISKSSDRCIYCGWTWKASAQEQLEGPGPSSQSEMFEQPAPEEKPDVAAEGTEIPREIPIPATQPTGPNPIAILVGIILCALIAWLSLK